MSTRQRNSASAKAWLETMRRDGEARATRAAQLRVVGAVSLATKAGMAPFEAAAHAVAAETGRPVEEVRAWLTHQVEKFNATKAKLEAQYVATEPAP